MSVLIKGMEIPTSCNGCPFNFIGHCMAYKWLYVERKNLEYNSKPEWCPLVPVPPHGRLIDADALTVYMLNEHYRYRKVVSFEDIENAPTIIHAEEGE